MRVPRLGYKACVSVGILLAVVICASSLANASSYKPAFLTADQSGFAPNTDPNLINPWGISFSSTGPFWVSDNNSGLSTIYNGTGKPQSLVVTIPPVGGATSGTPTGTVFNGTTGFVVSKNGKSAPAAFLFDSEDGSISGWSPTVDATNAVVAGGNPGVRVGYKAWETAKKCTGDFLFGRNFLERKNQALN